LVRFLGVIFLAFGFRIDSVRFSVGWHPECAAWHSHALILHDSSLDGSLPDNQFVIDMA
jgi:hypothetical protein